MCLRICRCNVKLFTKWFILLVLILDSFFIIVLKNGIFSMELCGVFFWVECFEYLQSITDAFFEIDSKQKVNYVQK